MMRQVLHTAPVQVAAAATLLFAMGGTSALNVFTASIEAAATRPHALDNLWAPSLSSLFYISSLFMVPCGILFSKTRRHERGKALRNLANVAAICFLLFSLAAPAVRTDNRILLVVSVVILSVAVGILAVIGIEHVSHWIPDAVGMAVAIATPSIMLGTLCLSSFFHALLEHLSAPNAIAVAAFSLAGLTCCASVLLRTREVSSKLDESERLLDQENQGAVFEATETVSIRELMSSRDFWLFVFVIIATGAGFPFIPYFFRMSAAFRVPQMEVLRWFQGTVVASLLCTLALSAVSEVARTKSGPLACGARNVLVFKFGLQLLFFWLLSQFIVDIAAVYPAWAVLAGGLRCMYGAGYSMAALLAADIFGTHNMAIVLGIGGGIALSAGEVLAAGMLMLNDAYGSVSQEPEHYRPFYFAGAILSALAVIATVSIRQYKPNVPALQNKL